MRKKQVNQVNQVWLKPKAEFKIRDNKKYKVKAIIDSAVYNQQAKNIRLSLYYPVL